MNKRHKYKPFEECKQAVIFARVSSEEQTKGASIDAQLKEIREYCNKNDLIIKKTFHIAESSTRGERKKFYEMLAYVKEQKRKTAIVVHCIDRLQRGYKECVELDNLREADRIEMHFFKESLKLNKESSSTDIMRWDMGVLSAKMYVGSLRDNVIRSQKYIWSKGQFLGFAPIGYLNKRDADKKAYIEIDPNRAPIVKMLFEKYATGIHSLQSLTDIAKDMNLKSLMHKRDMTISRNQIHRMLVNPFYYGYMYVKGELRQHAYEPLISKALFDQVQDVLTGRARAPSKRAYGEKPYAFRGLIRCATCGCVITSETRTKKNGKCYTYLKCNHLRKHCKQGVVNENILFDQLNEEIFDHIHIPEDMLDNIKKNVRAYLEKDSDMNASVKRNATIRLAELKEEEARLRKLYLKEKISDADFDAEKIDIEAQRKELQGTLERYAEIGDEMDEILECVADIAANASVLFNSPIVREKQAILNLILSDSKLNGTRLCYCLQKPFDMLLKQPDCNTWCPRRESNSD